MRLLIALAVAPALLCSTEVRAGDLGNCYNAAADECDLVYPDKDWGDKAYRQCIRFVYAECDARHKSPSGLKFKALPGKKPLSLRQR